MQPPPVLFIWKVRGELRDYRTTGLNNFGNMKLIFPEDVGKETFIKHAGKDNVIAGWRLTSEQSQVMAQGYWRKRVLR